MRKVRFNAVTAKNITTGAERDIPAIKGKDGAPGVKGDPGADGAPGPQGIPGQEGQPGFSPEVTIFEITGGHRVTITDAEGDHSFDVMDGQGSIDDVTYAFIAERLYNNTTNLTDEQKLKIETWLGLSENYLTAYNETPYQVTGDYNPAHKKYVDGLVNELQLFKFPNATIIGEPTINNGQISGFSATSYLKFPFLVDFNSRPFEINMEFTTGSNVTSQENIFDSDFGLAFAVRNSRFVIAVSTNGTSWNLGEGVGTYTVLANTTYRVKLWWDRMTYHLSYSVNGGNTYTEDITKVGAFQPAPKQMYIGVGETFATVNNHFTGIINMNHCNLSINGQLIWQGMDDAGLATRLEIDMSNIDADGIAYINGLINKAPSVQYKPQTLTPEEKTQAVTNIGLNNVETLVLEPEYREIKVLTEEDYNALTAYVDSKVSGLNAIIGSGVIE